MKMNIKLLLPALLLILGNSAFAMEQENYFGPSKKQALVLYSQDNTDDQDNPDDETIAHEIWNELPNMILYSQDNDNLTFFNIQL